MSFINDYSRKTWVYSLKSKDQTLEKFKAWKTQVKLQSRKQIKYHIIDNGLEFYNESFNQYCMSYGITRHRTVTYTPQ